MDRQSGGLQSMGHKESDTTEWLTLSKGEGDIIVLKWSDNNLNTKWNEKKKWQLLCQ